jgi:23S rRNA (uracil1939-C5)-methyltransferase
VSTPDGISSARAATARKPRRGDVVVVHVDGFDARGAATGSSSEYRVRLRRGLPGELVRARVIRRRRARIDAVTIERLEESPRRVPPRCAHFGSCGGCAFQDLEYGAQLEGKRDLVESAFAARPALAGIPIEPVLPAPDPFGYRNKMEFSFGAQRWIESREPEDAPLGPALGLHARTVYSKVVDVASCPIQSPAADRVLAATREIAIAHGLSFWDARTHAGLLRHLVLRVARATGEILVAVVTSEDARDAVDRLARDLLERDLGITTIVHGVNARPADTAVADDLRVVFGPGTIRERLFDLVFSLSLASFFQTNTKGAERLVDLVREEAALAGTETVFDLYCGTGALGLSLARSAREIVGFEITPSAVLDARANAAANGIANARFVEGDVLAGISDVPERPDLVLLDPPRPGLHPRVIPALLALAPPRIVHVSCNPAALARDLEALVAGGYRAGPVRPIDLFPHTPHVECVVRLDRDGD